MSDHSDFQQSLKHYVTAALGVAGASAVAMAQSSAGRIVYTPANIPLTTVPNTVVAIDFNHDGVTDLTISATGFTQAFSGHGGENEGAVWEQPATGNLAVGGHAIPQGLPLVLGGAFRGSRQKMAYAKWWQNVFSTPSQYFKSSGPFKNVTNKYLGVKFQINGQMHYGWVRISLACSYGFVTGTITGYAYDTLANRDIRAGQIRGGALTTAVDELPAGSLGMLAAGASTIPYWRK